jgi:hypothetical protein
MTAHMRRKPVKRCVVLLLVAGMVGCNTFVKVKPNYSKVPVDALREVAIEIERAVQEGDRQPEIANREGIVVDSDVVKQAIRTRAARSELVNAFRATGHAWERRNGMIHIIRSAEYKKLGSRQDRDRRALLIWNEEQDRWRLYEGILKDSNFPRRAQEAIQRIFYEARLEVLPKGQKYEDAAGEVAVVGGGPASAEPFEY